MTFLELANKVKDLAGVAGNDITNVSSTTNQMEAIIVAAVQDAWIEIQADPGLRGAFLYQQDQLISLPAQTAIKKYTYSDFSLASSIQFVYDKFYYISTSGTTDTATLLNKRAYNEVDIRKKTTGTPLDVIPITQNSFYLYPTNNEAINLRIDYISTPTSLSSNSDTPSGLESADHMAIVYKALITYAIYDDAQEVLQFAVSQDSKYMTRLYKKYAVVSDPQTVRFNCLTSGAF